MKKILLPLVLSTLASFAQAATLVVDSTDDSLNAITAGTTCTLRGAVAAINNGSNQPSGCANSSSDAYGTNDTIKFSLPSASTIKVVNDDQITISKSLIIEGMVDASGNPDITLDANSQNRIFYVTDGDELTITGVKFTNGDANASNIPHHHYGGAILVADSASPHILTLEHCTFDNNQAASGGAVWLWTTANISNSVFTGNEATDTGGSGGAVGANIANISDSIFTSNTSYGGNAHGAVSATTANISNSIFIDNKAPNGEGGAVGTGRAYISNSAFIGNMAGSNGGAIFATGTTNISNSTFSGNGGAIYTTSASSGYRINISNSTFSNNTAQSALTTISSRGVGNGGAVYVHHNTTANISNSTFSGNRAAGNTNTTSTTADGRGGAVYAGTTLTARHLTLLGNTAVNPGQALYSSASTLIVQNSIIIGSSDLAQCAKSSGSATGNYNLEGRADTSGDWQGTATSCGSSNPVAVSVSTLGDIINLDLADNGGPTQTLALTAGSPAIDAADPSTNGTSQMWDFNANGWTDATEDQRGSARVAASIGRDVGAYESNGLTITGTLPDGVVGFSYTGSVSASNGTGTVTYALGNGSSLPPGLVLDPLTGTIFGTPTQEGTFSFTIVAKDSGSPTLFASQSFTITITPSASGTPIPALPAALLLALAAAVGLLGRRRLRQGA